MPIYKPGSSQAIGLITRAQSMADKQIAVNNAILKVQSPTGDVIYPWCGLTGEGGDYPVAYDAGFSGWQDGDDVSRPPGTDYQFIRHEVHLSNVTEQYENEKMYNRTCTGHIYELPRIITRRLFMAVFFTAVDCVPTFGAAFYRSGRVQLYRTEIYDGHTPQQIETGILTYNSDGGNGAGFVSINTTPTNSGSGLAYGFIDIPFATPIPETYQGYQITSYVDDTIMRWGSMVLMHWVYEGVDTYKTGKVYIHKLIGTMV